MNIGVIEGFYGKSWSFAQRQGWLSYLSANNFTQYCYAPKPDRYLRQDWLQPWPQEQFDELIKLRCEAKNLGIRFDIGLSPWLAVDDWGELVKQQSQQKLEQIKQLAPDTLLVLFDDMQCDYTDLAQRQVQITADIMQQVPDADYLFCPSFYSFDEVLPEIFGAMPQNYWQDLGKLLPSNIGILWTGDKVISESYSEASIAKANQLFNRQVTLWDNSLANDGKKTSPYLKFAPMLINQQSLPANIAGVYFNTMNQAAIAQQVLMSFFTDGDLDKRVAQLLECEDLALAQLLAQDYSILSSTALSDLTEAQKQAMRERFQKSTQAIAKEVLQWLDGYYQFDPACLT